MEFRLGREAGRSSMSLQQTIATAGSKQQAESICTITKTKYLELQGRYILSHVRKQDPTVNVTSTESVMYFPQCNAYYPKRKVKCRGINLRQQIPFSSSRLTRH